MSKKEEEIKKRIYKIELQAQMHLIKQALGERRAKAARAHTSKKGKKGYNRRDFKKWDNY